MSQIVVFYGPEEGFKYRPAVSMIASLLAERGHRVLVVDWSLDLMEQPHRIGPEVPGLLDLLVEHAAGTSRPAGAGGLGWRGCLLRPSSLMGAQLLPAGRVRSRDERFDWDSFYSKARGGGFLESLRDAWLGEFDTVLIHCPPGSGARDICVVQMADILALGFPLEPASARDASILVQQAQAARQRLAYDRLSLLAFPMPWLTKNEASREQLEECARFLAPCYSSWLPGSRRPWQALESARLRAGASANGASCLFATRLIEQGFRNAAELIPLPENSSSSPADSWSKHLDRRPVHFSLTFTRNNEIHVTLTQDIAGFEEAMRLGKELIEAVRGKEDADEHIERISLAAADGVEIDKKACDVLRAYFTGFATKGCSVAIQGPQLQKQLGTEGVAAFSKPPPEESRSRTQTMRSSHFSMRHTEDNELQVILTGNIGVIGVSALKLSIRLRLLSSVDREKDKDRGLISLAAADGVEIHERARAALVQYFRQLAGDGYRVVIQGRRLQEQLGAESFTPESVAQGLVTNLDDVRRARRNKN